MAKKKSQVPRALRRAFPQVKTCTDATEPLDVEVTTGDVSGARRMEGDSCAMARAVVRQTKADGALVGLSYAYIVNGNRAKRYLTSPPVQREITSFDRTAIFEAGKYRLASMPPSQRYGSREQKKYADNRKRHDRADKRRIVHRETVNVRSFRRASGVGGVAR